MPVDDGRRRIGTDGFSMPAGARDAARRLRGRLASPVTVWTAGSTGGVPAGITVSSVLVAEGDPPVVAALIGALSGFWDVASATGRFVVHVLGRDDVRLADHFAGRYPERPFEGVAFSPSPHGPLLDGVATRFSCRLEGGVEAGHFLLVRGVIEGIELGADEDNALVHYRGRYVTTSPRRPS